MIVDFLEFFFVGGAAAVAGAVLLVFVALATWDGH